MKTKKELIIGKKVAKKLTPQQKTFNRLIRKLEKLRRQKDETAKDLSEKLEFYSKHIYPLEEKIATLHSQATRIFYKFYREKKTISKLDEEVLIEIIHTQFNEWMRFGRDRPDDELKEIFEFLEGQSFDEAAEEDFQAIKEDMSETFRKMGFDIDLDEFSLDLSEEDAMHKMREILESIQEQAETKAEAEPKRKKTKRQLSKEQREKEIEEAKTKNIAAIYKQLARVLHPDLEPDAGRREEKESLMKQLTSAYKNNDLHTLLRLELEWLHQEEDNLEKLSSEKLKIYNQALKEQTEELEAEIYFSTQHPRYFPLQKYVRFFGIESINLKAEKRDLEEKIKFMEEDIADLTGKSPLKKLREILRIVKKEMKKPKMVDFGFDFEDLFR